MVLVDDVVPDAQIGEARERATQAGVGSRRLLAEDLRVREEHEPELAPDETAARRRDGKAEVGACRERLARGEERPVHLPEQPTLALRLAAMRERDDDPVPGADEALELVLRLGEPTRGNRGPLRLEAMRLPLRERIERSGPVELEREPVLVPDPPQLVRLPHEIGRAIDRRYEIGRRRRCRALLVVAEVVLDEVRAALGGGINGGLVGSGKRTLGERREGAHLLDLVAEEVDANGLPTGGGEHVHDPAPDGELAPLVDAVDALVAGEGQVLREAVDARLVSRPQRERHGARLERREPVRERASGGADEAARSEDVERAIALAHEVRRRREPGLVRDTAAREERDIPAADEPACRFRRVAGVSVLGQEDEQAAAELLVERGEKQRENRLGDARRRRERPRERLKPIVPAQLVDERRERCQVRCPGRLVHAVRRGSLPAGSSYWRASG